MQMDDRPGVPARKYPKVKPPPVGWFNGEPLPPNRFKTPTGSKLLDAIICGDGYVVGEVTQEQARKLGCDPGFFIRLQAGKKEWSHYPHHGDPNFPRLPGLMPKGVVVSVRKSKR